VFPSIVREHALESNMVWRQALLRVAAVVDAIALLTASRLNLHEYTRTLTTVHH
jgi:hypothetical protein